MTFQEFEDYQTLLLSAVKEICNTKGKEYANGEDRFGNFNRLADFLELSNLTIAWIYTIKHIDSLESYIKNERELSEEKIEGRIIDIITYLTLIAGMIKEGNSIKSNKLHEKVHHQKNNSKGSRKFDPSYIQCGIAGCKLPASKFKIEPISSGSAIYMYRCRKTCTRECNTYKILILF